MPTRQRYVSNELTHFVGRGLPSEDAQYALLLKIIRQSRLTHPPHDKGVGYLTSVARQAAFSNNEVYQPGIICFCDIPVGELEIHMEKYSPFGLGFTKQYLIAQGANPVFYMAKNAIVRRTMTKRRNIPRSEYFDWLIPEYHTLRQELLQGAAPGDRLDFVARVDNMIEQYLLSFIKFFDDTKPDDDPDNFYMEREWRVWGYVDFTLDAIRRIIIPETFAEQLRADLPAYHGQVTFAEA